MKKHFCSLGALLVMIVLAFGSTESSPSSYRSDTSYISSPDPAPPPPEPTPKEAAFKSDLGLLPTPFGMIDLSTVKEQPDGKIRYTTSDGQQWEVEVTQDDKEGYLYGEPVEAQ